VAAIAGGALVAGLGAATAAMGTLAVAGTKTAISVESAFAGVAKTTDGLVDEFGNMTDVGQQVYDQFVDLSTQVPVSVEELMRIGEIAGQLGIGREALAGFTKTVADLSVATDLTQESAAKDMARLANIFEVQSENMVSNMKNVGSSLVALGNNFAASEPQILKFAQRIGAAGKVAGLTQQDVLGIGTAFTAVGVPAARGGTAVQRALQGINKAVTESGDKLEVLAQTSGVTTEEFAEQWEDDAAGAFAEFVQGLGSQGDNAFQTLEALDLGNQRTIQSFMALAGAGDLVEETIREANGAFEEGNALQQEVQKRYQTTRSQLKMMRNELRSFALRIGNALLPVLNRLLEHLEPVVIAIGRSLADAFETIGPHLMTFLDVMENVIGVGETFKETWKELPEPLQSIAGLLGNIINLIEGDIGFGDLLPPAVSERFSGLVETLNNIRDKVKQILGIGGEDMPSFAGAMPGGPEGEPRKSPFKNMIPESTMQRVREFRRAFETISKIVSGLATGKISLKQLLPPSLVKRFMVFKTQVIDPVARSLERLGKRVIRLVVQEFNRWSQWIAENRSTIIAFFRRVGQVIGVIAYIFGKIFIPMFLDAFTFIRPLIVGFLNHLRLVLQFIMNVFLGRWGKAWENVKQIVKNTWVTLKKTFWAFLNWAARWITKIWQTRVGKQWRKNWDMFHEIVRKITKEQIPKILRGLRDWFLETFIGKDLEEIRKSWKDKFEAFKSAVEPPIDAIKTAVGGITDAIKSAIDALESLGEIDISPNVDWPSIPDWVPGVGGGNGPTGTGQGTRPPHERFAMGGILQGGFKAFQRGGIVRGPQLGLIGEGRMNEAVVPLPGGRSIPVDFQGRGGTTTISFTYSPVFSMGDENEVRASFIPFLRRTLQDMGVI
jgi:TP901 family phage tail tape measure protein